MNTASAEEWLTLIHPSKRILLLPHCLRRSNTCQGKYGKWGLECCECNPDCPVNHLRKTAINLGYKGVCIAPGGRLAINYVKKYRPEAIVAVACQKELEEGIHGVQELTRTGEFGPPIVIIPLVKDGCVDTEVDKEQALEMIALGCSLELVKEGDLPSKNRSSSKVRLRTEKGGL